MIECTTDDVPLMAMPKGRYFLEDRNAGEIMGAARMRNIDRHRAPRGQIEDREYEIAKHIHLVRPGGIGDLVWLTVLIDQIQTDGKTAHVHCFPQFHEIFNGLDCVVHQYPMPEFQREDLHPGPWIEFENCIENAVENPRESRHILDLLAGRLWRHPEKHLTVERLPRYNLEQWEIEKALERFPKTPHRRLGVDHTAPRIALQFRASGEYRCYPHFPEVMYGLFQRGYQVFVLGSPWDCDAPTSDLLVNTTTMEPHLSIRESVALLSTCDVLVAPDSAMIHFASALQVDTVGVFGPIKWQERAPLRNAHNFQFIQGTAECAPCNFHASGFQQFPDGMPCAAAGVCIALALVPAKRVVTAVNKLLGE